MSRRRFVTRSLGAGLLFPSALALAPAPASAIDPIRRQGVPRLSLGLAAYSFRNYFRDSVQKRDSASAPARQIDLFQFIDFCAEHGCDGAELTSYYFPSNLDSALLLQLKRHAFLRGIAISGTAVGNIFTLPRGEKRDREIAGVKRWIDYAQVLGAPHIRIFAGSAGNLPPDEARRLCIEAIEECCDHAGRKGVMLGLENHGGIVAEVDGLLDIVKAVSSPWFGVNLDTGNFHSEDPYEDLMRCVPYAVNVQFKVEIQTRGAPKGPADLERIVKMLKEGGYQGFFTLEYEASPDPWVAVPAMLSRMKALL